MSYDVLRQLDNAPQLKSYVYEVVHYGRTIMVNIVCFVSMLLKIIKLYLTVPHIYPAKEGTRSAPWQSSLSSLQSLRSYKLTFMAPAPSNNRIISSMTLEMAVDALQACRRLCDVNLDISVYSYHVRSLRRLHGLSSVQLGRPSRSVISQMGFWSDTFTKPLQLLALHVGFLS